MRTEEILKEFTGQNLELLPKGNIGKAYLRSDVCGKIPQEFPEEKQVAVKEYMRLYQYYISSQSDNSVHRTKEA